MNFLRKSFAAFLFIFMILVLIVGFGAVDNAVKLADNNHFLNIFRFDSDNYILWFRYFGLNGKINLNFAPILYNIQKCAKIVFIAFCVLTNKVLNFVINMF